MINWMAAPSISTTMRCRKGIKSTRFTTHRRACSFTGDPGFPGSAGHEQQVVEFFAAPRIGMGCERRRPHIHPCFRAERSTTFLPRIYHAGLSNAPPLTPRYHHERCEIRKSVGKLSRWRSIPDAIRTRCRPRCAMAALRHRHGMDYDTPNMQVASGTSASRNRSEPIGSYRRVISETTRLTCGPCKHINPAVFLGTGPVHAQWRQYTTCSTTANTDQRRRLSLENPQIGTVLRLRDQDRHRRHSQL